MSGRRQKFVSGYGETLELIEKEIAAGASYPHIVAALHAQFTAGLFSPEKRAVMGEASRYGYTVVGQPHMGSLNPVRVDVCSVLHSAFLQHILAQHVHAGLDAVFEIGCGIGHDLVSLATRTPSIPFYGGEIATAGRAALAKLAAVANLKNVTPLDFDIEAPDFSFLAGKNVMVFSHMALIYSNPFSRDFFPRLLDTVATANVVLFEPVSFELASVMTEPPRFTAERARGYNFCDHLLAVIRALADDGRIIIEELVPDISGRSGINAVTLIRFKKAG